MSEPANVKIFRQLREAAEARRRGVSPFADTFSIADAMHGYITGVVTAARAEAMDRISKPCIGRGAMLYRDDLKREQNEVFTICRKYSAERRWVKRIRAGYTLSDLFNILRYAMRRG